MRMPVERQAQPWEVVGKNILNVAKGRIVMDLQMHHIISYPAQFKSSCRTTLHSLIPVTYRVDMYHLSCRFWSFE